ncbi:MAG: DHA2 family efflux MFS transporter permease subunit [Brasilonema sp.]
MVRSKFFQRRKKKSSLESPQENLPLSQPPVNKWLVTIAILLGSLLAVIDTSIVNVAIPQIQTDFRASIDEISSVVTFYIISNVIVMPLNGYIIAMWGRKQSVAGAIILFTVASLLCGLAWNLPILVFFRIIQGLSSGVLLPSSQAILLETFPQEEHGKAMSILGVGTLVGPTLSPVLGGYLTDIFGWRAIFVINIPLGIIAAVMAILFIYNPPYINKPQGKFDWPGLIALVIGLSSLQYALESGQRQDWLQSKLIISLLVVGVLALTYLVYRELVTRYPIIDLSVFSNLTFVAGNILAVLTGFILFGILFILPLFMSQILHYDALAIGVTLMPGTLATGLVMPLAGLLADRLDPRIPMGIGIAFASVGTWQLSHLTMQSGYWDLFWPQIWRGIGLGLVFVPMSSATVGCVSKDKRASASGLFNLIHQLGGSVGIAGLTIMLQRMQAFHISNLSLKDNQQAVALAYSNLFYYSALIFIMSYLALLFIRVRRSSQTHLPIL